VARGGDHRCAHHQAHWTVVAHAHPTEPAAPGSAPLAWAADTVLAGSFSNPARGNYDGKYFEDDGRLYLLYIKTVAPAPALRNAIIIQPMLTPTQSAQAAPTTLLTPGDRDGELESEWYGHTQAKLVEAPYISKIGDKYALVYSTGAYLTPGYKAGVAWSDTLLPPQGGRYRKVLEPDPQGLWGQPGRREVRYLIQSEKPRWPNFTGGQVIGPGVAAAVQGPGDAWWLYFNGFAPGDMAIGASGKVNGALRRPYFLRLRDAVPLNRSVASATDAELAEWLMPEGR
jgi:Glycosyl hydrolases family 43